MNANKKKNGIESFLENKIRLLIGLSSIIYILGFLTWATFAFTKNLGYVPVFKEQYLIAGIFPILILMGLLLVIQKFHSFVQIKFINYPTERLEKIIEKCLDICMISPILIIPTFLIQSRIFFLFFVLCSIVPIVIASAAKFTLEGYPSSCDKDSKANIFIFQYFLYIITGFLIIVASSLWIYVGTIFPLIPREFGGPKGECVFLDIKKDDLSPMTSRMLFDSNYLSDSNRVIRSKKLYLIFESGDFWILKVSPRELTDSNEIIRLKEESIMNSCDCKME